MIRIIPTRKLLNFKIREFSIQTRKSHHKGREKDKVIEADSPATSEANSSKRITIEESTVFHLEQLSLVECSNKEGVKTLEDAIEFANKILHINTDNIEPMYTVLEDRYLNLREDKVTDGCIKNDILKNAVLTEEEYFVAPTGNIPLEPRSNLFTKKVK